MTTNVRGAARSELLAAPALTVVRHRWWLLAITMSAAVAVAVAGLSLVTPTYQATATLQVPIATGVQAPGDLTYIDRLMNTYTQLTGQPSVRGAVARSLGVRDAPTVTATVKPNTELLLISVRDSSPERAARGANAAAQALVNTAGNLAASGSRAGERTLTSQIDALAAQITSERLALAAIPARSAASARALVLRQQISGDEINYQALVGQRAQLRLADAVHDETLVVVQSAGVPAAPASPRRVPVLVLAVVLGLLGGLGIMFMLERRAPRLYTVRAIEDAAGVGVLAAIPRISSRARSEAGSDVGAAAQEAFGVLAVHVLAEAQSRPVHSILVTSRASGDGKSTVAANLAAELSRSAHRVLIVDADLRDPSLHRMFALDAQSGLSNLLESPDLDAVLDEFISTPESVSSLSVLTAGPRPASAPRWLASARLKELITRLTGRYDFVIFDSPALSVSDPLAIAQHVDLVLLITAGDGVPDREIQAATRELANIGARYVSVVANRWGAPGSTYAYANGEA